MLRVDVPARALLQLAGQGLAFPLRRAPLVPADALVRLVLGHTERRRAQSPAHLPRRSRRSSPRFSSAPTRSSPRVRRAVNLAVHVLFYPSYWLSDINPLRDARLLVAAWLGAIRRLVLRLHHAVFGFGHRRTTSSVVRSSYL